VKQPLVDLGNASLKLLLSTIENKDNIEVVELEAELVIRSSSVIKK